MYFALFVRKYILFGIIAILFVINILSIPKYLHNNFYAVNTNLSGYTSVDFKLTAQIMWDMYSYIKENPEKNLDFSKVLACVSAYYNEDFTNYNTETAISEIQNANSGGESVNLDKFDYYYRVYSTIFDSFIGENAGKSEFGMWAFEPVAEKYVHSNFEHFFGSTEGHYIYAQKNTAIRAIEAGIVNVCEWNENDGWFIEVLSLDSNKIYKYSHLNDDTPFSESIYEGKHVNAGEELGFIGKSTQDDTVGEYYVQLELMILLDDSNIHVNSYEIIDFIKMIKNS